MNALHRQPSWIRLPSARRSSVRRTAFEPLETRRVMSGLPALESFSGASATLLLDFDGHTVSNYGRYGAVSIPAYNAPGSNASTIDSLEEQQIRRIWQHVAEDFAPFDINVTTVDPGSSSNLPVYRVAIGGNVTSTSLPQNAVGFALSRAYLDANVPNLVFAFPYNPGSQLGEQEFRGVFDIAHAVSHEAGHGFGLEHQTVVDASGNVVAVADGDALMGYINPNSPLPERTLWKLGPGPAMTQGGPPAFIQDDLQRLASAIGVRSDDHGNSPSTASVMTMEGVSFEAEGIIERASDADYFRIRVEGHTAPTRVRVSVNGTSPANDYHDVTNLDARLEIRDTQDNLLYSSDPANDFGARINEWLAPGTYYLVVRSHGDYGDLGRYKVWYADGSGPKVIDAVHRGGRQVRVTFSEPMDLNSWDPTNSNVLSFHDAAGQPIVFDPSDISWTAVPGFRDTQFDLRFPKLPTEGMTIEIGPNLRDRFNNRMDQNGDGRITLNDVYPFADFQSPHVVSSRIDASVPGLVVRFSEPMDLDDVASAISITDNAGTPVGFQQPSLVSGSNHQEVAIPLSAFPSGGFHLTIGADARDEFGNRLDQNGGDYEWTHTDPDGPRVIDVAQALAPWQLGTGNVVGRSNHLIVAFSEPIDASTIGAIDFKLASRMNPSIVATIGSVTPHSGIGFVRHAAAHQVWMLEYGGLPFGTHQLQLQTGPHIEDLFGNEMDQNQDGNQGETSDIHTFDFKLGTHVGSEFNILDEEDVAQFVMLLERLEIPKEPPYDPVMAFNDDLFRDLDRFGAEFSDQFAVSDGKQAWAKFLDWSVKNSESRHDQMLAAAEVDLAFDQPLWFDAWWQVLND